MGLIVHFFRTSSEDCPEFQRISVSEYLSELVSVSECVSKLLGTFQ